MTWLTKTQTTLDVLVKNPVLLDYLRRRAGKYVPITEPEDVIGEQMGIQVGLALQAVNGSGPAFQYAETIGAVVERPILAAISFSLGAANPYLWLTDVRLEAVNQPVPRHVFTSQSVPETMWWTFDTDVELHDGTEGIGSLIVKHERGVECIDIVKVGGAPAIRSVVHLADGYRYPDDCKTKGEERAVAGVLAMLSFLGSPYIPKAERRMSGRLRKTFAREGATSAVLDRAVRFIDLRSPEPSEQEPGGEGSGAYRHRWIVRGHHRAQWFPSLGAHKVIWVAPYVKGPEGAPMLSKAYRVRR